ncbi:hypothetical protein SLOPH_2531 [Spraguea lophii 42_110]|uniref:Uncharacterized protein n=1 Tax=Spraguea lophii (strain 42_110) TaxID=1358809 RepID=S7XPF4_SPRLO|nr:hypothetical protein SLOPH_2531 [Spraguea lophii 42_110]
MSENTNKIILKLLRIYKGKELNKAIFYRLRILNDCYRTTIKNTPSKLISVFKNNPNSLELIQTKAENNKIKVNNTQRKNNKRLNKTYKINDMIYLKNQIQGKLERARIKAHIRLSKHILLTI